MHYRRRHAKEAVVQQVLWIQRQRVFHCPQVPLQEFLAEGYHRQAAEVTWLDRPVHREHVAVVCAPGQKPLAPQPHEERGQGMGINGLMISKRYAFCAAVRELERQMQIVQSVGGHGQREMNRSSVHGLACE